MKKLFILTIMFVMLIGLVSCGTQPPKGNANWKDEGKSPIIIKSASIVGGVVAKKIEMIIENITDTPVSAIQWTMFFFDSNGKFLADGVQESGYGDSVEPIPPGETTTIESLVKDENIDSVKVVLKSVIYETLSPLGEDMGTLPMIWKNPNYDKELVEAKK